MLTPKSALNADQGLIRGGLPIAIASPAARRYLFRPSRVKCMKSRQSDLNML
jgi:hypothetical protein